MPEESLGPQRPPHAVVRDSGGRGDLHAEHRAHLHRWRCALQPLLHRLQVGKARALLRPRWRTWAGREHAAAQQHGQQQLRVHVRPATSCAGAATRERRGQGQGGVQRGVGARQRPGQPARVRAHGLHVASDPPFLPRRGAHHSAEAAFQLAVRGGVQLRSASQGPAGGGVERGALAGELGLLRPRLSPCACEAPALELGAVAPARGQAAPAALEECGSAVGLRTESP
mmetsp:Transcript_83489/g.244768  ORF Transcript_83489/g.244768 Transcript_83489/m.244768 type:complete len:228 (+) Transcript_83489:461-1144(+)